MAIAMTEFTNGVTVDASNVVTGSGIFDDMMEPVNTHIKAQYDEGRINGSDYATVYLGALQSVIAESVKVLLEKDIRNANILTEASNKALVDSKILTEASNKVLIDTKTAEVAIDGIANRALIDSKTLTEASNKALVDSKAAEVAIDGIANRTLVDSKEREVRNKITQDTAFANAKLATEAMTAYKLEVEADISKDEYNAYTRPIMSAKLAVAKGEIVEKKVKIKVADAQRTGVFMDAYVKKAKLQLDANLGYLTIVGGSAYTLPTQGANTAVNSAITDITTVRGELASTDLSTIAEDTTIAATTVDAVQPTATVLTEV